MNNFSTVSLFVSYKSNRIQIATPVNGITVREVLRIACDRLELRPRDYNVTRNGNVLQSNVVLFPFSDVSLMPHEPTQQATLQTHLWHITTQVLQEEALKVVARDVYQECVNYIRRLAHLGLWETTIKLPPVLPEAYDPLIPPAWVRFVTHFDALHQKYVLKYLKEHFHGDALYPTTGKDNYWHVTWKQDASKTPHVRLTARELVSMGYKPEDGDLFGRIMHRLRGAIIDGTVNPESVEAQKDWVKKHFI